ncbi:MAG: hypothetical protein WCA84_04315 [Ignavibacteriaceae bacterium]
MKKHLLLLTLMLFCCNLSFSQGIKFIVLTSNGDISLIRNSIITTVKAGVNIIDKDKLKVGKYSYIDLVYKDGRTLEITSAGTYSSSKLITMADKKKNSSSAKFGKFVLAEFVKSINDLNNMKVAGAVERLIKAPIDYCTPPNTNILDPIVTFTWFADKDNSYTFRLTDISGNVLYSSEITDTSITLNLQQLDLSRDNSYKWFVKDNKRENAITDTCRFYWLSQTAADSIKKSVGKLLVDFNEYDHSIKQTLLASFYSRNKLYIDMLQAYERAMVLAPENDIFKKLYLEALNNLGLDRMAEIFRSRQHGSGN